MRAVVVGALLLWQLGAAPGGGAPETQYLRYQREIQLPAGAAGQACAVLDGASFAHAASGTADDLRLFATRADGAEIETPFAMTESAPEPDAMETAAVRDAAVRDGELDFDLAMPARTYTDVELQLNAKNFLGAARVMGVEAQGVEAQPGVDGQRGAKSLGTFAVFDLSDEGLGRSTTLSLVESPFAMLHIELRLTDLKGRALADLSPGMIAGAEVPPSRSGETLYTTVAATSDVRSKALSSFATLRVAAHVPVERVRFVLDPAFREDFFRDVTVSASPLESGNDASGAAESVSGRIFRVERRAMPEGMPAIDVQQMGVDVALGSNLRSAARVMINVYNSYERPLPIERIELEMRQRRICFDAGRGETFVLRYGDAALRAPSYTYARSFRPAAAPVVATLGPEAANPHFIPRPAAVSYRRRNPSVLWMLLLAVLAVTGVVLLQLVRYRQGETR